MEDENVIDALLGVSLDRLCEEQVDGDHKSYSFGRLDALDEHVLMLRAEFVGQPKLFLYHSILTTLIRREIDLGQNVERFYVLWRAHPTILTAGLDSRWLVSACDTMIDHPLNGEERAFAVGAMLFANMLKLHETERVATGEKERATRYALPSGRVALHDGMSAFMIGHGDMIANLRKRVGIAVQGGGLAAGILAELLHRARVHDTVLQRFEKASATS